MSTLFRYISAEIFSITTVLFVVLPFVIQLSSSPDTSNQQINAVKSQISSVVSFVDIENRIGSSLYTLKNATVSPVSGLFKVNAPARSSFKKNAPIFVTR